MELWRTEGEGTRMFLGEYQHTLDPKGRVILPSAFRDDLADGLVMTVGIDNCLTVYPRPDWHDVVIGLRNLRTTDARQRSFARVMLASAHPDALDRQGRVTVPARLRQYAALTKEVTIVGADRKLEVWDSGRWESYRDRAMAEFASTETPFELGQF